MILQTIERVATWLGNGTYGVNPLLPGVPRLGTDPVPPAVVAILDERQHQSAARGQVSRDQQYPVLLVMLAEDVEFDIRLEQGVRDAPSLPLVIAYAVQESASNVGSQAAFYTMVAVEQSLRQLFYGGGTAADRASGAVRLVRPAGLHHVKLNAPLGDLLLVTAIRAAYYVRDTSP